MSLTFLIPPLIGGFIGYITNAVAIKMLFRPRKAYYIFGHKVPFTPGLIPREKSRVARSVGRVVSTQLLNTETLSAVLASESTTSKIRGGVEAFIEKQTHNTATIEEALLWFMPKEAADKASATARAEASRLIYDRITSESVRAAITDGISKQIKLKLGGIGLGMLDKLADPIARGVGDAINKTIAENGMEVIDSMLVSEIEKLKGKRICDMLEAHKDKLSVAADVVKSVYMRIVSERLDTILEGLNIAKIVEDKIDSFDVIQLEEMIFGIMKKELNAIVYLGALLGFIMGWLNLLIKF